MFINIATDLKPLKEHYNSWFKVGNSAIITHESEGNTSLLHFMVVYCRGKCYEIFLSFWGHGQVVKLQCPL